MPDRDQLQEALARWVVTPHNRQSMEDERTILEAAEWALEFPTPDQIEAAGEALQKWAEVQFEAVEAGKSWPTEFRVPAEIMLRLSVKETD